MKKNSNSEGVVLAIFPSAAGFGYAVFEGPRTLIDWGVKIIAAPQEAKNAECLLRIGKLLTSYRPQVVVLEDYAGEGSRKEQRVRRLIRSSAAMAGRRGTTVRRYSRAVIRATFVPFGETTKYGIATTIAKWFPELRPQLPPARKMWLKEDYRMNAFDAVSLALTHFSIVEPRMRAD